MLSTINVRLFSNDQYVLDKVVYSNFYRIKKLEEGDVVVDIGAHVGFFSLACMLSGSKRIYAYEPLPQNYEILVRNVETLSDKIKTNNLAAFFEYGFVDFRNPTFDDDTKSFDFCNVPLAQANESFSRCICCPLNNLLTELPEKNVRILKVSIGGGELQLLNGASKYDKVNNIVGETAEDDPAVFQKTIEHLKGHGFVNSWFSKDKEDGTRVFIFSKGDSNLTFKMKD
jgi:FkbM family methyltransferase